MVGQMVSIKKIYNNNIVLVEANPDRGFYASSGNDRYALGFVPPIVQSYAIYGYEAIMGPGSFVSNICQGAASLAVAVKTKNKEMRQIATSAGITALLGVTEPAMFGVTLKLKRPLYAVMIGGAFGGLYAGLNGVVRYTSGTPGLASFAVFIGENPKNIVHAFISVGSGFVITFVLTWILAR